MKLRWKLLIVLVVISAIPLFLLNYAARETSHGMVRDMTEESREVLIARAKADLLRRIESHANMVSRERQIVALALRSQTGRLRQLLEGGQKEAKGIGQKGVRESAKHVCPQADGASSPLYIDKSRVRLDLLEGASIDMEQAEELFRPMVGAFRKLEESNSDLVYWQLVRLANGAVATYPYYEPCDPEKTHFNWVGGKEASHWYRKAELSDRHFFWTRPFKDPVTGRLVMASVAQIQKYLGEFHGMMMVMVQLGSVFGNNIDDKDLAAGASSLLLLREQKPSGDSGLRILAEESRGTQTASGRLGWDMGVEEAWLGGDEDATGTMGADLSGGRSGIIRMEYKGEDCLWFYAPIRLSRLSLVLVVPMERIIGTTRATEHGLRDRIESQFRIMTMLIWGLTCLVLVASIVLSKAMTRRISSIVRAFNNLAGGDFSTRVKVGSRDEIGDLGQAFNALAPALEEQVRLKEALTIAQEVQRSLLPEGPPQVPGLDVAGISMYCEDTGGDYFDYPHLGIEADEFGLAVGDVSGHGVPAALLMTTARALLRQRAQHGGSLGAVVGDANRMLSEDVRLSGRFMTLFLFAVDMRNHTARWVRAGHDPALVYHSSTDSFGELGGDTGLPLGVDGDWEYIEEQAALEAGSVILIGTDGIWEAADPQGGMFGKDRLRELLREHAGESAQGILDVILQALRDFTADAGFEDDVTLAVVKVLELP